MVPLPATLPSGTIAEIHSFLLCLQSKCLVRQSERGVAVQLHKVGEGSGVLFLKKDFQTILLFLSSLLPPTLPEIPGPLNPGSLGDSVVYIRLLLSLSYCWVRIQLSQICQAIYTYPAAF